MRQAIGNAARRRTVLAATFALLWSLALAAPQFAAAYDPSCSPNPGKWYGVFYRVTSVSPMKGGHDRIEKVGLTPATSGYLGISTWVYTTSSLAWFAEINYGYNANYVHGPAWGYFYRNGSGDHWADNLPFNATADYTMHDVTIKNIGSGQWYGYIDGSVAMLASGLNDNGVYRQDVGIESDSCRSHADAATLDNFTAQNWDDSWSPWFSGSTSFTSPVAGGWLSYPTSGYSQEN